MIPLSVVSDSRVPLNVIYLLPPPKDKRRIPALCNDPELVSKISVPFVSLIRNL